MLVWLVGIDDGQPVDWPESSLLKFDVNKLDCKFNELWGLLMFWRLLVAKKHSLILLQFHYLESQTLIHDFGDGQWCIYKICLVLFMFFNDCWLVYYR